MTKPFTSVPLPAGRSTTKPRRKGLTMMMDWGLPLGQQEDWLGLLAPVVDLAKLVVGTARLYEEITSAASSTSTRRTGCDRFSAGSSWSTCSRHRAWTA